ncbi:MAG: hypothetical protein ACJAZA_001382, partial [Shewanella psychromarinicola]
MVKISDEGAKKNCFLSLFNSLLGIRYIGQLAASPFTESLIFLKLSSQNILKAT